MFLTRNVLKRVLILGFSNTVIFGFRILCYVGVLRTNQQCRADLRQICLTVYILLCKIRK